MRRDWQRGMTLVELLVGMAVTSILLAGLAGVFLGVSGQYQVWAKRLDHAAIGPGLAASLQADSHRYVVCGPVKQVSTLYLCQPDDLRTEDAAVRYDVGARPPYVITRQSPAGGTAAFMARSQSGPRPYFTADCFDAGNMVSGHIHVYNLRPDDGAGGADMQNFMVYYAAPWRPGC
jgi:prepilin-type N-terminal cleavage/methylation domain-containing protein